MTPEEELKALQEIESLSAPAFESLLNTNYYDTDLKKTHVFSERKYISISNTDFFLRNRTPEMKKQTLKQIEYLKRVLPYTEKEGEFIFDYEQVKYHLQNELPQKGIPII